MRSSKPPMSYIWKNQATIGLNWIFSLGISIITSGCSDGSNGATNRLVTKQASANSCNLHLSKPSIIQGFWLGMSETEYMRAMNEAKTHPSNLKKYAKKDREVILSRFIDGRLSYFTVKFYNLQHNGIDDLINTLAKEFKLPHTGWEAIDLENGSTPVEAKILDCDELSIKAWTGKIGSYQGSPSLIIEDKVATEKAENKKRTDMENTAKTEGQSTHAKWYKVEHHPSRCVPSDGPAALIRNHQTLGLKYVANDVRDGGIIVETTIESPTYMAAATYYRDKLRCENTLNQINAQTEEDTEKYEK